MFKFWRQHELHAKDVAICECAPQTSELREQSPVRDMKKKKKRQEEKTGESIYANNSNLYQISYNKVDK